MTRIILVLMVLLDSVVWAGVAGGSTLLTIGTEGPDRYADGTQVLDGETYALVWRAPGTTFAGFSADGAVLDPAQARVLCFVPFAEGGRCPETTFAVDAKLLAACGEGGTFGLYLLDTRRWGTNGKATPSGTTGVHGCILVTETKEISTFTKGKVTSVGAFAQSAVPPSTPQPRISAIRLEGEEVVLTVTNTVTALNYNVAAGGTPAADASGAAASRPVAGSVQPIELRVPRSRVGGQGFMKVVRNPLVSR